MKRTDKYCPKCDKSKDISEFGRNARRYDGLTSYCKICISEYRKEKGYDTSERKKEYHLENKEKFNRQSREYYQKNREKCLENKKEYHQKNQEKLARYHKEWRRNNPDKKNASNNKRRASKIQRTPAWMDGWKVQQYYSMAKKLTESTGIKFVVDHIIPLQGMLVSGLHVENNLQIITEEENGKKYNKFKPLMGYK